MPAPQIINHIPDISHAVVIVFEGENSIRGNIQPYGTFIGGPETIDGINHHVFLVSPLYGHGGVSDYIVELGGTVYVRPPEPE